MPVLAVGHAVGLAVDDAHGLARDCAVIPLGRLLCRRILTMYGTTETPLRRSIPMDNGQQPVLFSRFIWENESFMLFYMFSDLLLDLR